MLPASQSPTVHCRAESWGGSSICASFLISLSSSKDGSDAWPCSGHIWDYTRWTKACQLYTVTEFYIYIPIRQLIGRVPIRETSCLKNHIPFLKVKDVLLAWRYVSGSGWLYFGAITLRVIVTISLRTGTIFLQYLAIAFRLITHMIIFRNCMTRLHPAFKQALFRNLWATYRASATVTWRQHHRYNVHKAFYRHSISVTSFDFFLLSWHIPECTLHLVYFCLHKAASPSVCDIQHTADCTSLSQLGQSVQLQ